MMNKKGDMTLKEVIELIIVGLIILAIVYVPWQVINFFRSDRTDATENNFDTLVERMKNMVPESRQNFNIYISSGYVIASFSNKDSSTPASETNMIKAPDTCKSECLCLCTVISGKCKEVKCENLAGWLQFPSPGVFIQGIGEPKSICIYKTGGAQGARIVIYPYECQAGG
jgi:hypothetical protein